MDTFTWELSAAAQVRLLYGEAELGAKGVSDTARL